MASTTAYQPFFGYVYGQVNQDLGPYGPGYDGFLTTHSTLGRPGHSAHVSQTSRRPHHFRHAQFAPFARPARAWRHPSSRPNLRRACGVLVLSSGAKPAGSSKEPALNAPTIKIGRQLDIRHFVLIEFIILAAAR